MQQILEELNEAIESMYDATSTLDNLIEAYEEELNEDVVDEIDNIITSIKCKVDDIEQIRKILSN